MGFGGPPAGASRCPVADDGDQGHHRGWVRWRRLREVVWEQQATAEGRGAPPPPGLLPSRRPLGRQRGRFAGLVPGSLGGTRAEKTDHRAGADAPRGGRPLTPNSCWPRVRADYGSSSGAAPAGEASAASLRSRPPFPAPASPGSCRRAHTCRWPLTPKAEPAKLAIPGPSLFGWTDGLLHVGAWPSPGLLGLCSPRQFWVPEPLEWRMGLRGKRVSTKTHPSLHCRQPGPEEPRAWSKASGNSGGRAGPQGCGGGQGHGAGRERGHSRAPEPLRTPAKHSGWEDSLSLSPGSAGGALALGPRKHWPREHAARGRGSGRPARGPDRAPQRRSPESCGSDPPARSPVARSPQVSGQTT